MGKRRCSPRSRAHAQVITPESGVTVTLRQALIVVGVIFGAGGGYAYLAYTQFTQGTDITAIRAAQQKVVQNVTEATKEQEDKRAKLGEAFLQSQRDIASQISTLNVNLAVQQQQMKTVVDSVAKLADQIDGRRTVPH